ncbi:MAG: isochorismate synthase, partial [Flavobacterium sp.]
DLDVVAAFKKLIALYPTAFRYLWFHRETGIWMGATPEQLIKANDKQFNTVALAGTQAFSGNEQVEWQQKEIAEQQFVTDFISESLMSSASGMTFSDSYTAKAGNLLHIKTDIQGTLNTDASLEEVLKVLHPTPAVCGFPKADAKEFITANEGYDREFYSGFLGELNKDFANDKKASELYVNLRCMKIDDNNAHLFIGCGITKDSIPENEFTETVNKSLTMKKVLNSL